LTLFALGFQVRYRCLKGERDNDLVGAE